MQRHASCLHCNCSMGRGRALEPGDAAAYLRNDNMKKMLKVFAMLFCVAALGLTTSCEKEDDIEGIEMRMRNASNGGDVILLCNIDDMQWTCPYGSNCYEPVYYSRGVVALAIDGSNNLYLFHGSVAGHDHPFIYYDGTPQASMNIASVGKVSGLGGIKKVPNSGWTDRISITPGKGYVVKFEGTAQSGHFCKYARVYVSEWIEGTSGGILGAVIRYEDNWMP